MLKQSAKQKERREKFQKLQPKFLWDKDYRAVTPEPWGIRKSDGFEVLQIITSQSMSRLEKLSEGLNLNPCES